MPTLNQESVKCLTWSRSVNMFLFSGRCLRAVGPAQFKSIPSKFLCRRYVMVESMKLVRKGFEFGQLPIWLTVFQPVIPKSTFSFGFMFLSDVTFSYLINKSQTYIL